MSVGAAVTLVPGEEAHYWSIRDIAFHCRMGRSTAWRLVREGGFPAPVVYGQRCLLWPREEVIEYMEARRDPGHYRRGCVPTSESSQSAPFSARPVRGRARG